MTLMELILAQLRTLTIRQKNQMLIVQQEMILTNHIKLLLIKMMQLLPKFRLQIVILPLVNQSLLTQLPILRTMSLNLKADISESMMTPPIMKEYTSIIRKVHSMRQTKMVIRLLVSLVITMRYYIKIITSMLKELLI